MPTVRGIESMFADLKFVDLACSVREPIGTVLIKKPNMTFEPHSNLGKRSKRDSPLAMRGKEETASSVKLGLVSNWISFFLSYFNRFLVSLLPRFPRPLKRFSPLPRLRHQHLGQQVGPAQLVPRLGRPSPWTPRPMASQIGRVILGLLQSIITMTFMAQRYMR